MVIKFVIERETKNTARYNEKTEKGKPPAIGVLYVQKWALGDPVPEEIELDLILPGEL